MKTLWKVFWIAIAFLFLIIIIDGLLVIVRGGLPFKEYLPPIAGVPAAVALFAYAFRKKVRHGVYVWRVYLFAFMAFIIYQDWSSFSNNNNIPF
jgi:hypothetical protein